MKQHHFNLSHHCQSITNQNNEHVTCDGLIIPPRPMIKCDGTCFQRNFCQHPSYHYHPIPHMIVRPWSIMPLTCNPSFNYPCHELSSYQVTVRRMTPLPVAAAAYRPHRNKDSDKIYLEPFNRIIMSSHQKLQTTQTNNFYEKDYFNSDNHYIPSVPTKKIISKNNGLQVSSTSFILTTDDQKSFNSDYGAEKSSERHMIHCQTLNELSFSLTELDTSNNDSFTVSKPNSIALSRSEMITTKKNVDNISIDTLEKHEKYFIEEELSPSELSRHNIPNELNINTPESTIKSSSMDISRPPTLPSSKPPDINKIKSNEMLINPSRSKKSITSLTNRKQKSSTDTTKSNLPIRPTRSTLDFGLLIHETTADNF